MLLDGLTIPLGIMQSLDTIFSAVLVGGIDRKNPVNADLVAKKVQVAKECRARFVIDFPFNIFKDTFAVFYEIIATLKVKTFTVEQLKDIIDNNRDLILDSPFIDKAKYNTTDTGNIASDDDILTAITLDLVDKFNELSYVYVTEEEYKSAVVIYIDWFKSAYSEETAQNMTRIMSDIGFEDKKPGKRTRVYHGVNDMHDYYNERNRVLKALSEDNKIQGTVIDTAWFEDEVKQEDKLDDKSLIDIGIKEIDSVMGKLRRGNMLGIMGPPKGGKTRFTNYIVNRCLRAGLNVCVWPLEGTKEEWLSTQTACYIASVSYENAKTNRKNSMIRISSKDILQRNYVKSPVLKKEVIAAKAAIATSTQLGRLSFIEGTAFVEDMLDVLQAHYDNENPFDVLVIDQLVNVLSSKGKGKVERISEAYMLTKDFLANKLKRPALGLMPAQLKQEVVDGLRSGKLTEMDVTAGGESSETIRTPDAVIGLFSSNEERANNMMHFYNVACRHSEQFDDFIGRCYLECCFFTSEDDDL
jgi:KaiC/GvpD/RAD55 family RecA-like ATPase